tara:strand:- start:948 stop:1346 length:399 start_codon:yes stop_codon:yes gene_type:complete
MLQSIWNLVAGVITSIWSLLTTLLEFGCDLAVWLHTEAPRLEGLLVGILLAWLLSRREAHPLLRVASAPLKLVLDILDLAWNQIDEVVVDLWDTTTGWTLGSLGWLKNKAAFGYSVLITKLTNIKDKLAKKE